MKKTSIEQTPPPPKPVEDPGKELSGLSLLVSANFSMEGRSPAPLAKALEGYTALEDAAAVRLLKSAGAEFPSSPTVAETFLSVDPALALKESAAALTLDTLGETRLSAASAALIGYKPSYGIFSRAGVIGLIPSMECPGIIAREISQIKKIAAVLASPDESDFSMLQKNLPDFYQATHSPAHPPKLGLIKKCRSALSPEESGALNRAVQLLEKTGCAVQEISLPDYDLFPLAHQIIGSVEASSSAGNYDGVRFGHRAKDAENWNEMYLNTRREAFSTLLKSYLFQGAYFQFEDYAAFENACRIRRCLVEQTRKLFQEVDFLILPARRPALDPENARTVAEIYEAFTHTLPANVLGAPAITLSKFALSKNSDLGLQLIGPPLSDAGLLQFAARITEPGDNRQRSTVKP